jgi:hypothetical protein
VLRREKAFLSGIGNAGKPGGNILERRMNYAFSVVSSDDFDNGEKNID